MSILIMNGCTAIHLAQEADPEGTPLLAGLPARTAFNTKLPVSGPGTAEFVVNQESDNFGLRLHLHGRPAAVGQVVWRQERAERFWLGTRRWQGRFTRICHLSQPPMPVTPPACVPWMAVVVGPRLRAKLNREQRLKIVALMRGRAFAERQAAGDPSAGSQWAQFSIKNGRVNSPSFCPDPLTASLAADANARGGKKG